MIMGMDVMGIAPIGDSGRYFGLNISGWHPLATFCETAAADIACRVRDWHSNDGDGLNGHDAKRLGERLLERVASGYARQYIKEYCEYLAALPDIPCTSCEGTGSKLQVLSVGTGMYSCYSCRGTGLVEASDKPCYLMVELIIEFADFCIASGGFEIW